MFAIPDNKKIILVPARISRGKGQAVVVAALQRLKKYCDHFHVVFLGDEAGNDFTKTGIKRELQNMARQRGVDQMISWVPHQDTVAPFYHCAYFTLLPSVSGEGLPRVLIENMVCGKPSIATRLAGVPEVISDDINGYTCLPGSPTSLAEALEKALHLSAGEYGTMCCKSREIAEQRFTFSSMIQKYEELYRSLLPKDATAGPIFIAD
jgi:glycosyltransferase involved in cell wall biosynthesis